MGVVRVTWPKFKIWEPLHNFWMVKVTCSKFCAHIRYMKPFYRWIKNWPEGAWLRSRDPLWNFGTPFITSKWLKIETSYLVHASNITCSSQCTTNWPLQWACSGSCDLNLKFDALHNFWTDKDTSSKCCTVTCYMKPCVCWWKIDAHRGVACVTWPTVKFWDPLISSEQLKI